MIRLRRLCPLFVALLFPIAPTRSFASPVGGNRDGGTRDTDPRIATAIEGLDVREERLREVSVTYEFHNVWTEDGSLTSSAPGSRQTPAWEARQRVQRSRITWARKERKMLFDEFVFETGGRPPYRRQQIYDGEKILTILQKPATAVGPTSQVVSNAEGSQVRAVARGAVLIALRRDLGSFPELIRSAAEVRCLGFESIGGDRCLVLDLRHAEPNRYRTRLWLDVRRGFLARKLRDYRDGELSREILASEAREWSPGLFIASRVVTRIFWRRGEGKPGSVRATQTATLEKAAVGGLPDHPFDATPKPGARAFDMRTGAWMGTSP
jgi:hypothetical protein